MVVRLSSSSKSSNNKEPRRRIINSCCSTKKDFKKIILLYVVSILVLIHTISTNQTQLTNFNFNLNNINNAVGYYYYGGGGTTGGTTGGRNNNNNNNDDEDEASSSSSSKQSSSSSKLLEAYAIMVTNTMDNHNGDIIQRACELAKNIIDIDTNQDHKIIFMTNENDPIIIQKRYKEMIDKHCVDKYNYDYVVDVYDSGSGNNHNNNNNNNNNSMSTTTRLILKQIPKFPIEFQQKFHAWEIAWHRLQFFDPKNFHHHLKHNNTQYINNNNYNYDHDDVSLVVLDVDILIRKDISELFQITSSSTTSNRRGDNDAQGGDGDGDAPGAFVWQNDEPFPNGGVWVIKPSTYIYERLVQKAKELKLSNDKATIERVNSASEQTFLVYALQDGGILDKFIELPSNYNLILSSCNQLGRNRLDRVKVVHSTCGPKFWSRYDKLDPNDNSCEAKFTREWEKSRRIRIGSSTIDNFPPPPPKTNNNNNNVNFVPAAPSSNKNHHIVNNASTIKREGTTTTTSVIVMLTNRDLPILSESSNSNSNGIDQVRMESDQIQYPELAILTNFAWSQRHGYEFRLVQLPQNGLYHHGSNEQRSLPYFWKSFEVAMSFQDFPYADWVIYLDTDSIIVNPDMKVEDLVKPPPGSPILESTSSPQRREVISIDDWKSADFSYFVKDQHMITGKDVQGWPGACAGVFAARNTELSLSAMCQWWNQPSTFPMNDQGQLNHLLLNGMNYSTTAETASSSSLEDFAYWRNHVSMFPSSTFYLGDRIFHGTLGNGGWAHEGGCGRTPNSKKNCLLREFKKQESFYDITFSKTVPALKNTIIRRDPSFQAKCPV